MVRLNLPILFGLQALSGLATAFPAISTGTSEVSDAVVNGRDIFLLGTIDSDTLGLNSQSIYNTSDSDISNASLDAKNKKRDLSKRLTLDSWQEVNLRACWSIDGVDVDHTAYINDVYAFIGILRNNGRSSVTIQAGQRWLYTYRTVRFVVRNQNQCNTRVAFSDEMAQNLEAIYYRCQNHASGWGYYTSADISGNAIYFSDFAYFAQPTNADYPGYVTSC